MNRKISSPSFEALRRKAKRLLDEEGRALSNHENGDPSALLYEIALQRVELELQNEALRRANKELEAARRDAVTALYHFAPLPIFSVSPKGIIERCNASALRFLHRRRSQLVGGGFADIVVPEDRQAYGTWMRTLTENDATNACRLRVSVKDGRRRHVRLYAWSTPRDRRNGTWQYALVDVTQAWKAQKHLKQSRDLYRSLAANMPNGAAFIVDHDLTYVLAEGQALNAAGLTSRDLEGKTLHEALDPDLAAFYEPHYRTVLSGTAMQIEHSSHDRYYVTHMTPLRGDDGAVHSALAVSYDITQRRKAEQALKDTQERFRLVVEATKIGPYSRNLQTGEDYWSPEFLSIFGLRPGNPLPLRDGIPDAVHPDDRERVLAEVRGRLSRRAEPDFVSEHRIIRPDGRTRWVMTRGRLDFDEDLRPLRINGIVMDITDRKEAEETLSHQREVLKSIFDTIPVLLVMWEPHLERFTLNRHAEKVLGLSSDEANEGDFMQQIYPDPDYRGEVSAYMLSLEPGWREWQVTTREGERVPIDWANVRLSDDTMIGIGVDLRERKQAEAALRESNEILNEYAYALTHNVKAPFRAVQNYANFLLEDLAGRLEKEPKQYLDGLKRAVSEADQQFRDLETLYRIRNHEVDFEALDVPALLDEIAAMYVTGEDQRLVVAEHWPPLTSERFLLRQILMGLISNGFKYNRSETKQVAVSWRIAPDQRFEIVVRDNGIGIDPRYHGMIFQIFKRLHTEEAYEGTGIGLAIVKRAVQKIGGSLSVESALGEGSTFVIGLSSDVLEDSEGLRDARHLSTKL